MSSSSQAQTPFAPRRIVTSHASTDTDGSNVIIHDDRVPVTSVLDGKAHLNALYAHSGLPSTNTHSITSAEIDQSTNFDGIVLPGGVNGRFTELAPDALVPYHRTSSVDYNVVIQGSVTLITPLPDGGETRTVVDAGEVVIQRGTLHAWEAGPDGARWYSVIVAAKPVQVGDQAGKELEDVDF